MERYHDDPAAIKLKLPPKSARQDVVEAHIRKMFGEHDEGEDDAERRTKAKTTQRSSKKFFGPHWSLDSCLVQPWRCAAGVGRTTFATLWRLRTTIYAQATDAMRCNGPTPQSVFENVPRDDHNPRINSKAMYEFLVNKQDNMLRTLLFVCLAVLGYASIVEWDQEQIIKGLNKWAKDDSWQFIDKMFPDRNTFLAGIVTSLGKLSLFAMLTVGGIGMALYCWLIQGLTHIVAKISWPKFHNYFVWGCIASLFVTLPLHAASTGTLKSWKCFNVTTSAHDHVFKTMTTTECTATWFWQISKTTYTPPRNCQWMWRKQQDKNGQYTDMHEHKQSLFEEKLKAQHETYSVSWSDHTDVKATFHKHCNWGKNAECIVEGLISSTDDDFDAIKFTRQCQNPNTDRSLWILQRLLRALGFEQGNTYQIVLAMPSKRQPDETKSWSDSVDEWCVYGVTFITVLFFLAEWMEDKQPDPDHKRTQEHEDAVYGFVGCARLLVLCRVLDVFGLCCVDYLEWVAFFALFITGFKGTDYWPFTDSEA